MTNAVASAAAAQPSSAEVDALLVRAMALIPVDVWQAEAIHWEAYQLYLTEHDKNDGPDCTIKGLWRDAYEAFLAAGVEPWRLGGRWRNGRDTSVEDAPAPTGDDFVIWYREYDHDYVSVSPFTERAQEWWDHNGLKSERCIVIEQRRGVGAAGSVGGRGL